MNKRAQARKYNHNFNLKVSGFLEVSYMIKYLKDNIQRRFFKLSLAGADTVKTVTKLREDSLNERHFI